MGKFRLDKYKFYATPANWCGEDGYMIMQVQVKDCDSPIIAIEQWSPDALYPLDIYGKRWAQAEIVTSAQYDALKESLCS